MKMIHHTHQGIPPQERGLPAILVEGSEYHRSFQSVLRYCQVSFWRMERAIIGMSRSKWRRFGWKYSPSFRGWSK